MRLLLTRPRADSEALAATLRADDLDTLIEPLIEIVARSGAQVDLRDVQAVLLTSVNGARALATATPMRDVHIYAVGNATAGETSQLGFHTVSSAGGDVADLARLIIDRLDPAAGALLHVAGSVVAGDLAGRLTEAHFRVRRAVLYEARTAESLSRTAVEAIQAGKIDGILFFSPRTATTFVTLARRAGLTMAVRSMVALCLSSAVADAACALDWRAVRVPARPDQAALLGLIESGSTDNLGADPVGGCEGS